MDVYEQRRNEIGSLGFGWWSRKWGAKSGGHDSAFAFTMLKSPDSGSQAERGVTSSQCMQGKPNVLEDGCDVARQTVNSKTRACQLIGRFLLGCANEGQALERREL